MQRVIVSVVIVVAVGLVVGAALRCNQPSGPAQEQVPTAKVRRGDIVLTVEATGSVESNLDVEIKSKASGEVMRLPYDVSDRVPKHAPGRNDEQALLVALDPIDEQRNVERAKAQHDAARARLGQSQQSVTIALEQYEAAQPRAAAELEAAKAKAKLAALTMDRVKKLLERNSATQQDLDTAQSNLAVAEAEVKMAQAKIDELAAVRATVELRRAEVELAQASLEAAQVDLADAQRRLEETRIYSPIEGVVTSRDVSIGQIVASGIITVGGGTVLMTVSDLSRVFIEAVVDESDIGRLVETGRLGQEVLITADAYPGRRFSGVVERITPRGVTEAKVVSFIVKIEVMGGGKELLLPKMTANVTIGADERTNVLLVPNAAIQYDKDRPYVNLRQGSDFVRREVKLGLNDGIQAEAIEGLAEGDEVKVTVGVRSRWSNEGRDVATGTDAGSAAAEGTADE